MAKSINITYGLIGACHTTFTITDNLGNVVATGITGAELTQDLNLSVDDAATSITVHSENCSITHNLPLPTCTLADMTVTKECDCYMNSSAIPDTSNAQNPTYFSDIGRYQFASAIFQKSTYTADGGVTREYYLLFSPNQCDDDRVEIRVDQMFDPSNPPTDTTVKTGIPFYASTKELKAGFKLPEFFQFTDGTSGVFDSLFYYTPVKITYKTDCGEFWTYTFANTGGLPSTIQQI